MLHLSPEFITEFILESVFYLPYRANLRSSSIADDIRNHLTPTIAERDINQRTIRAQRLIFSNANMLETKVRTVTQKKGSYCKYVANESHAKSPRAAVTYLLASNYSSEANIKLIRHDVNYQDITQTLNDVPPIRVSYWDSELHVPG